MSTEDLTVNRFERIARLGRTVLAPTDILRPGDEAIAVWLVERFEAVQGVQEDDWEVSLWDDDWASIHSLKTPLGWRVQYDFASKQIVSTHKEVFADSDQQKGLDHG